MRSGKSIVKYVKQKINFELGMNIYSHWFNFNYAASWLFFFFVLDFAGHWGHDISFSMLSNLNNLFVSHADTQTSLASYHIQLTELISLFIINGRCRIDNLKWIGKCLNWDVFGLFNWLTSICALKMGLRWTLDVDFEINKQKRRNQITAFVLIFENHLNRVRCLCSFYEQKMIFVLVLKGEFVEETQSEWKRVCRVHWI